jgi:hypothetical protein
LIINKIVCLYALLLLLPGCVTTGKKAMPEWVMNPPSDSASTIYGVGEGASMRTARDDALGVVAGKLKTRVQADVQTETLLKNGEETSTTRNRVQTTTEALKLSDFQVEKSGTFGGKRFVLLALDRRKLIEALKSDLATIDKKLQGQLQQNGNPEPIKRLYRLNRALPNIQEAISLLSLIRSVDSASNLASKSRFYNDLLSERESMTQSITLGVRSDASTQILADKIVELLLSRGVKAERAQQGQNYDGLVKLSGTEKKAKMFGEKHVNLKVQLDLLGDEGGPISSALFDAGASSLTSFEAARDSANRLIGQEMTSLGIWSALKME